MKKETKFKSLFEHYGFTKKDERKYPVISRILKELTPEKIKKEIREVQKIKLSPELQKWVRKYEKVGDSDRNEYLWKWIYRGTEIFTKNNINKKYLSKLLEVKLLLFIFDTFLDDIADKSSMRNEKLLKEIIKVPFQQKYIEYEKLNKKEKENINFAIKMWNQIKQEVKKFPRYKEFKDIFKYDIYQFLNALKYSYLLNENNFLINQKEAWIYLPHSMQVVLNITLELMHAPEFNIKELGLMREFGWRAQNMSRIGNWVSTWEREIGEKDFTSAVFACAISKGIISIKDLNLNRRLKIIKRIKKAKIEKEFLKEWEKNYLKANNLSKKIKSFNTNQKTKALKKVIFYHLSSVGLK